MEKLTSRKHPQVRHLRLLGSDRDYRIQAREFVCDGLKMLDEARRFGAEITGVVWKDEPEPNELTCTQWVAPAEIYDYISPLKNSPGPLFTVKMPPEGTHTFQNAIVLANVQDPGNVGTAIRTANAFRIGAVILTEASADLYNPKTVRASMGAVFRENVLQVPVDELRDLLVQNDLPLYGAALHHTSSDVRSLDLGHSACAIGSEGKGLSEKMLGLCDALIVIPMNPDSESLNAAQASTVIMWEMARKVLPQM